MRKYITLFVTCMVLSSSHLSHAQSTGRTPQFSNHKTKVWKTTIYPTENQTLGMHRHHNDRILVALTDGLLKITNNKGVVHYLKLKKNEAYFLKKDPLDELHQDENMSKHPITVMVIELKELPGVD